MRSLLLVLLLAAPASARSIASARDAVVTRTMDYLAVPYLWGGQHPKSGLDCSGFVQLVFAKSGLSLPRVARDQFLATTLVGPKQALPGDLLFFAMRSPGTARVDHVGIFVGTDPYGRGWFVHASTTNGVHIEPVDKPYYLSRLVAIRRYRGF